MKRGGRGVGVIQRDERRGDEERWKANEGVMLRWEEGKGGKGNSRTEGDWLHKIICMYVIL